MVIKVIGSDNPMYRQLNHLTEDVMNEVRLNTKVENVKDPHQLTKYGVTTPPALVINNKVKVAGRVPSRDEIKGYITEEF